MSDEQFTSFIQFRKDRWEDGEVDGKGIQNYESILIKANTKYKNLCLKRKWNTPSAQEQKIIALEAQLKKMEIKRGTFKTPKYDQKKAATPDSEKKKAYKECPSWMKKPPKVNMK